MSAELLDVERLARALVEPLRRRGVRFYGPVPDAGTDVEAVARESAAIYRLDSRSPSEVYDNADDQPASPEDIR